MRVAKAVKDRRDKKRRDERQAAIPMPEEHALILWSRPTRIYIAVCEHGYGVDRTPAMAIARAQTEVPAKCKPRQLLLYEALVTGLDFEKLELDALAPIGFAHGEPQWRNGARPRLVGLTHTHRLFKESPRVS